MRPSWLISLFLLLSCLAVPVHAALLTLGTEDSGRRLNDRIELLEDRSNGLTIEDILKPEQQALFQPAAGRTTAGQSRNPWWIRLELNRQAEAPADWWLEIDSTILQDLQLYLPDERGNWLMRQSGEQVPFQQASDLQNRRIVFQLPRLPASPEAPLVLYLRTLDPSGNAFPLHLWQRDDIERKAAWSNLLLGALYGIIFGLMLYNLFLLITLRDATYAWYLATTASALLMLLMYTGHGLQYLFPNELPPPFISRLTCISVWAACVLIFTQNLLQTRRQTPFAHRVLSVAIITCLAAAPLDAFGLRAESAKLVSFGALLGIFAATSASLKRVRQGYVPALYYLLGYGLVFLASCIVTLRSAGVMEQSDWSSYAYPASIAAESILFSLALAYRIQTLKQEATHALQLADQERQARLALIEANAAQLQLAVEQRTAELELANRQLSERERELERAALHDPLTELPNRRYLMAQVDPLLAAARRNAESVALLLIDLDHFKPINDNHGHDAGDLMLRTIAQRMRDSLRANDRFARLGGDEFAVLVSGPNARRDASEVAARLSAELARPLPYKDTMLSVSISIGVAFYPDHAEQFAGLYKAADEALYQAKQNGRSGIVQRGQNTEDL